MLEVETRNMRQEVHLAAQDRPEAFQLSYPTELKTGTCTRQRPLCLKAPTSVTCNRARMQQGLWTMSTTPKVQWHDH
eukprot:3642379-Amphidinium_carterae.1